MQKSEQLLITPETKLADLLNSFPQLEDSLLQMSPAYAKLKNPLLRKTIGKVATMQQVAEIGKIPIAELINKLRSTVGQDKVEPTSPKSQSESLTIIINEEMIVKTLDARPLLDQGIHPLGQVLEEVQELKTGELYELVSPFRPIPLIEKVEAKGFFSKSIEITSNEIRTYFQRNN